MANTMNTLSSDAENFFIDALPGQERYVAPEDETPLRAVDSIDESAPPTSMWADAWRTLRKNPLFIFSAILSSSSSWWRCSRRCSPATTRATARWTTRSPARLGTPLRLRQAGLRHLLPRRLRCPRLGLRRHPHHPHRRARRRSDRCHRRFLRRLDRRDPLPYHRHLLRDPDAPRRHRRHADVPTSTSIPTVVLVLALFGWTSIARITRGSVMSAKNEEFVTASPRWAPRDAHPDAPRHPQLDGPHHRDRDRRLGAFIVSEATLSFLGIGLPSTSSPGVPTSRPPRPCCGPPPGAVLPVAALALTVLAFIMMGDAVNDALDPKSRTA